mgnify:CR=1 FL=1|jgi:hypothetical protein|tara:strand:+ start:376 stop:1113 length:738 start_codon:yes stop_codon:yes gene_type:complete
MNVSDLYKFSLGQYGSVFVSGGAAGQQFSLLGSAKYLIGAIQVTSNRELTSADNSFVYLNAADINPMFYGTSYGGSITLQFRGIDIDATNNTIKIRNSVDWNMIRDGNSVNYWSRGQADSSLGLSAVTITASTAPTTAVKYYIINKNDGDKTIQLATSVGGSPISLNSQTDISVGNLRALTLPALEPQTTNKIELAADGDVLNCDNPIFASGDNIIEGSVLYGRWNFVRVGARVNAILYLIPKII